MKMILGVLGITFLTACTSSSDKVVEGKDGMYWSTLDSFGPGQIIYQVDTITQSCFAIYKGGMRGGITEISCTTLSSREEWQAILTWVAP